MKRYAQQIKRRTLAMGPANAITQSTYMYRAKYAPEGQLRVIPYTYIFFALT